MASTLNWFYQLPMPKTIFEFCLLFGAYLVTRFILVRTVKRWSLEDQVSQKKWVRIAQRAPSALLFVGILFIWGQELRDFALSLVAIAAALVLATKEVILCVMGGLLKVSTKLFEINDRISVTNIRGKVIDHSLLSTTLVEIGPGTKSNQTTGKFLKLPNSLFLTNPVSVVPASHDFILHVISVTMPFSKNWESMEVALREVANESFRQHCDDFKKFAKNNPKLVQNTRLGQSPRINIDLSAKDTIDFLVRITIPYDQLSITETELVKSFLHRVTNEGLL